MKTATKFPFFLHGGDYNPDQWRHVPGIVDEDFALFPQAGINSVSVGIFSWTALEPEEGRYEFGWLDDVMDRAADRGMAVVLATPSGAKPNWLAAANPEIRRMDWPTDRPPLRALQGRRHNHCFTSPVYRAAVKRINEALASRYGKHPALALWHVSNEYGGDCRCPLCIEAFRAWLRAKYGTLDAVNRAWWTGFWSHTYTDWNQIEQIDDSVDGLVLDWRRFVSHQTADFLRNEVEPLRRLSPGVPVTTNMMGFYDGLDYAKLAKEIDVVSWDCYPQCHERPGGTEKQACFIALAHDYMRSLKPGRPFLMMESSPGPVNWYHHNRLLRPGQHRMKSIQAVAHGSDSVQYFQIRKGRGGSEKFHGAVIDHEGTGNTRMFKEVAQVGRDLEALRPALGSVVRPKVAMIFDRESDWALKASQGPLDAVKRGNADTVAAHYRPYWKRGVQVDVVDGDAPLDGYSLVVAPSLFMLRDGFAERVERFVAAGGTFVATWLTGVVGPTGLCFRGGFPGPLRKVLGVWAEETDYLYDDESNEIVPAAGNTLGLAGKFGASLVCEVVHPEDGAETVAAYGRDFYAGAPALVRHAFGKGEAWYLATRGDEKFLDAFHGALAGRLALPRAVEAPLPEGVAAAWRE
ncbi:MAG: beta-galactosidase, partial [Kiritimatiellae bacterium]|nr:beta-galactosidase [Kiritimatiellia bacterium]